MKKLFKPAASPTPNLAAIIARRYRVSPSHANLLIELGAFGKRHTDREASNHGGASR